jgi:4-hydroxy-3-polyprenylbenzoate decarboxylase
MKGAGPVKRYGYENLRDFIAALESEGELLRIGAPVSPLLEITEITDRASKSPEGGKALLFEQVEGSSMPVLTNALGSMKRICMGLGVGDLDELGHRLREILTLTPPETWHDKIGLLKNALGWSRFLPRRLSRLSSPPCQQVILKGDDVDLTRLPILHCWPGDAGRFITLPLVFSKNAKGQRNVGMYRVQVFDRNIAGMHWHIHKDGSHHFYEYGGAGKRMEVAVAIGTDPAVTYAATAPMPYGVNEMLLAGFVRRRPVRMARCATVSLDVPAEAEIVLEGYVEPGEERMEGPFGDHTGFYSAAGLYPVFHVTAITHRRDAVYSATVVGRPPMEDCYLAKATERIFLPLLQAILPELVEYRMPWEGVFHNLVLASIEKRYPGHATRVMHALWGSGQMAFCKAIFVLDAPVDLSNGTEVARTILNTVDLERDIVLSTGIIDVLDHASPRPLTGGKIGVDATASTTGEGARTRLDAAQRPVPSEKDLVGLCRERDPRILDCRLLFPDTAHPLVLLSVGDGEGRGALIELLLSSTFLPSGSISVLFDVPVNAGTDAEALWRAAANVDPGRDIAIRGNRMVIDATAKKGQAPMRPWPEEIRMSLAVGQRVTARAGVLGIPDEMAEIDPSRYI